MITERKFFLLLDNKIVLDEKKLDSEIKMKKNYKQGGSYSFFSLLDDFGLDDFFFFLLPLLFCLYIVQEQELACRIALFSDDA